MRIIGKRWLMLACLLLCFAGCAQAVTLPVTGGSMEVFPTVIDGETWLFLPAFADADALGLSEADAEGVRRGTLPDGTEAFVMQSENLRALFLFSDDPENQGRAYVEAAPRHETRVTGSMALVGTDGQVDHTDDLRQLRGRGNGSWRAPKKPYQFKLESRADLLQTGLTDERARTWVLLAEAGDSTFLHNKLAFDLGLELGMAETSHSEYVDLYYDGEYRGLYLLAEKVEMDPARIAGRNYDDLLQQWNGSQEHLEQLPSAIALNRFGSAFTYIDGVADSGLVNAGAYLLEMESPNGDTLSDRCFFRMPDQSIIALKNPENASEAMMRYISERLQEARYTLMCGGVNPDSGRTIEDDFDVDAFARLALINELASNLDGFNWSSTFFVLPEGETRFRCGPVWDFDLAWRYDREGKNARGVGFKNRTGWLPEFYACSAFSQKMVEIWQSELYPLITDVLLGGGQGDYLQSLDAYAAHIDASRRMDNRLWKLYPDWRLHYGADYEADMALLGQFITERSAWMQRILVDAQSADHIELCFEVIYAHAGDGLDWGLAPWAGAQLLSYTSEVVEEATEDSYAVYEVEAVFAPKDGQAFEAPHAFVSGREIGCELQADGTARILFRFEDVSYRPVDYYGEDIGLIYDYESYIARYPEVAELCGGDPEAVMNYFCDEGMYVGHVGNAFFDPNEILLYNPQLAETLGQDWQNYYWDFLYYGRDEGWLKTVHKTFRPDVEDML